MTLPILPPAKTIFFDSNSNVLASGSVYMYVPNTTTTKVTWQDPGGVTANTSPITLDSAGGAYIFGSGEYRQVVYDSLGNLIWDSVTLDPGAAINGSFSGTSTTSLAIGTGAKTFTTQTGLQFFPGGYLIASSNANAANFMIGTVTSYNTTTGALVMSIVQTGGSGTQADWNISVTGVPASSGNVSTTGTPVSGNLTKFSGSATITNGDLSGDVTTSGVLVTTVAKIAGVAVGTPTGTGNVVFSSAPTLTNPVVGTQATSDSSTKAASTALVANKIANFVATGTTIVTPPTASGTNSLALGDSAVVASGTQAIAIGNSYAAGNGAIAIAIGDNTSTYGAQADNAVVIGLLNKVTGIGSTVIGGEAGNTCISNDCVILGDQNSINANQPSSFIIGQQNTMAVTDATNAGFNVAIGQSNTFNSTGSSTNNVAIGSNNSIPGTVAFSSSFAIGEGNTVDNSGMCIGFNNTATTAFEAFAVGINNISAAQYSFAFGQGVKTTLFGEVGFSTGLISTNTSGNDTKYSNYILYGKTTTATPAELFLDNSSARLVLANNSCMGYRIDIVGLKNDASAYFYGERSGICYRAATAATTTLVAQTGLPADITNGGYSAAASADTSNGSLKIAVTGASTTTINWVVKVRTIQTYF